MSPISREEYLREVRNRYKEIRKRVEKKKLIDEVVANLRIHRKSAIRTLKRKAPRYISPSKGKQRVYTDDLIMPLTLLWKVAGNPCSKRLVGQLGDLLDKLKQFDEIKLYGKQEELLYQTAINE